MSHPLLTRNMKIIIPGKPIPKMRARYSKRGKHVITYDPQDKDKKVVQKVMTDQLIAHYDSAQKMIGQELYKICTSKVFSVQFIFFLPVNASDSVSAKNKKLWGITRASTKPDYDNLEKFYLDCANGILWDDDASVVKAQALKLYSEEPRVEIVVNAVEDIKVPKNIEEIISIFSPSEFKELQYYAKKISEISEPSVETIEDGILQEWVISTAELLSKFSINFGSKLTKIAKIGDIKSEGKKIESFETFA